MVKNMVIELQNAKKIAKQYGKTEGFDLVWFHKKWNGYFVFNAEEKNTHEMIVGWPFYILIDGSNKPRMADTNEVFAIMEITQSGDLP